MSIVDEITRLTSAKTNIKAAIEAKGVTVPATAHLDAFPSYVSAIQAGASASIQALAVTSNGTYTAPSGVDGYSPVTVYVTSMASDMEDALITHSVSGTYVNSRVNNVGYYAFYGNDRLTDVNFPNALSVGESAFARCYSLRTAAFSKATRFLTSAFRDCSSLTSVSAPLLQSIYGACFSDCQRISSVNFPNVYSVSEYAFYRCAALTSVVLAPSYSTIASHTFRSCSGLSSVSFNITGTIYENAFCDCINLEYISAPSATRLSIGAFSGCTKLKDAFFPSVINLSAQTFYGCQNLSRAYFPAITYCYGSSCFANCFKLSDITFGCNRVEAYYFQNCSSIPYITNSNFPEIYNIQGYAFRSCTGISLVSASTLGYISAQAFMGCTSLRTLRLSGLSTLSSRYLAISAFSGCSALESVYLLGESLFVLGSYTTFANTPLSNSAYLGHFGSIFVPSGLYASYTAATNWVRYSQRFVSLTDAEIADLP